MQDSKNSITQEKIVKLPSGWPMLGAFFILAFAAILLFRSHHGFIGFISMASAILVLMGLFSLQPNEARVLVLFGNYKGTVVENGLHWGNPFYSKLRISNVAAANYNQHSPQLNQAGYKVSLRARTLEVPTIKVNDKKGNPIEIGAVVVWRIVDSAKALFDVENYSEFVKTQSETALRFLATHYAYDHGEHEEITLRSNIDDVSKVLCEELAKRLQPAGLSVDEAKLTHLAYAQEIAQAMLRRQQAEAVIAARQKIVHGAVTMVEQVIKELGHMDIVTFEPSQKAALASNLMVVLCSESEVHPVVNTSL